ncbi:hypothetical protein SNOG_11692 [Parastagonospora nodorum SN15]|uniref:Uncharacterized protein n=1 Tax=Phaeosphaeria nodorum (strain SN15 / ATCC MYA-4574 / FGSC 10173) TaxID=321614 RepID=Q0U972_PHANO|nr:hypothetical protein SNOG_11692 [Parastagonospora nodorum SN15]EAT80736.1 hypothetical protein SNOG_11692 [Parastagonospora nodorum SN15]
MVNKDFMELLGTSSTKNGKMVLYHANGRVVKAHEDYLEKEEAKLIKRHLYRDQIAEAKKKDPNAREQEGMRVRIVVDEQNYQELYNFTTENFHVEDLGMNVATASDPIPEEGLDRKDFDEAFILRRRLFHLQP